ncbi:MAG: hypothetical protein LBC84_00510 [Prevotellaceae bacterium]|jgi:hypothetical protein|nr:hypothetical protein [Prevotellaceae bacterium]
MFNVIRCSFSIFPITDFLTWVVGGQSRKMAKPIFGRGLAMRRERSEHGESQLSIKYLCTIHATFLSHLFFSVSTSCFYLSVFFASQLHCAVPTWRITPNFPQK